MLSNKRILILGCHLDDIEYGCGGFISRRIRENGSSDELYACVLSRENRDAKGDVTITRDLVEAEKAFGILGLNKKENICLGNIAGQKFQYYTQDIREELLRLRACWNPDVIFYPSVRDVHQDHHVLCEEAFRIFRNKTCIGYEIIRSTCYLQPNMFVRLEPEDVSRKAATVACYVSQLTQSAGYYFSEDVITSIARTHGARCGEKYAEAFEIYTMQI